MTCESLTQATADLIYVIESMLLQGMTRDMVEFSLYSQAVKTGESPLSPQAITDAYAAIAERWVNDASTNPVEINAFHIRARKHLYAKSYKLNDFKTCLQILSDLAKIQQQYAANSSKKQTQPPETGATPVSGMSRREALEERLRIK